MKPWQIALICVGAFIAALLAFGLMYVYAKWSKIDTKSIKADDIIINEEVKKIKCRSWRRLYECCTVWRGFKRR